MRALIALALLCLAAGCDADLPEGRFLCADSVDCPDRWFCRGDARCYSTPEPASDAGPDGGVDAGGPAPDAG